MCIVIKFLCHSEIFSINLVNGRQHCQLIRLSNFEHNNTPDLDLELIDMFTLLRGLWKYFFRKDEYYIVILGLDNAGKTVGCVLIQQSSVV